MKVQEYSAKTVESAIEEGLADLGITRDRAEIEELSKGGLFAKAKVRITVRESAGEKARDFLARTLELMSVDARVELNDGDEEALLEIVGDENKKLLNHRGETIDALQYLASLVANTDESEYRRIVLDSANYRQMREERLKKIADSMAERALERGYRIKLDPMNPYERRVIHTHLAAREGITTHSEGEEPNRFVVIVPASAKAARWEPKTSGDADAKPDDYRGRPRRDDHSRRGHGDNREYNRGGRSGDSRGYERGGERNRDDHARGHGYGQGRGGYDRGSRGERGDRPDRPPRTKPTMFGTILTTPVKTEDSETKNDNKTEE